MPTKTNIIIALINKKSKCSIGNRSGAKGARSHRVSSFVSLLPYVSKDVLHVANTVASNNPIHTSISVRRTCPDVSPHREVLLTAANSSDLGQRYNLQITIIQLSVHKMEVFFIRK